MFPLSPPDLTGTPHLLREYQDLQIDEVTHTLSKAFKDYNVSVNAAREVVEEEFGDPKIAPLAISG